MRNDVALAQWEFMALVRVNVLAIWKLAVIRNYVGEKKKRQPASLVPFAGKTSY